MGAVCVWEEASCSFGSRPPLSCDRAAAACNGESVPVPAQYGMLRGPVLRQE